MRNLVKWAQYCEWLMIIVLLFEYGSMGFDSEG